MSKIILLDNGSQKYEIPESCVRYEYEKPPSLPYRVIDIFHPGFVKAIEYLTRVDITDSLVRAKEDDIKIGDTVYYLSCNEICHAEVRVIETMESEDEIKIRYHTNAETHILKSEGVFKSKKALVDNLLKRSEDI